MLNSVGDAIQEMQKFIEECNKAQTELKKERNPKLKELLERIYKNFLKEERDDEAIQEMRMFIEECDKAQEQLSKAQELRLTELIERLHNFKKEVAPKKEEVTYRQEDIDKKISDIRKAAREVVSR